MRGSSETWGLSEEGWVSIADIFHMESSVRADRGGAAFCRT